MSAFPGVSHKQRPPQGPFDAIVIGSGVGGLACASALARYGKKRVLVLEQHYRLGGYTHTFTRPGYEWDVGVHYLGQLGEKGGFKRVFDAVTDGSLRWAPLPDVYDRIVIGGRAYDFVTGRKRFVEKLGESFPSEKDAIARYVDLCRQVSRSAQTWYLDRALPSWASTLAGPLLRRSFSEWAKKTTDEVLRTLTSNEELIGVLTGQYGDYGLPPKQSSFAMHAQLVAHYFGGAWYPVGGSSVIAKAFAPVIEKEGGVLCHSAEVKEVLVEKGRAVGVRMADGREHRASLVVSDAGLTNTYRRLLPEGQVPAVVREKLSALRPSTSYLCLYLGFKQSDRELGLDGTNLWLYPSARHDESVRRFLDDPSAPLPMLYASFASAKDPSWAERHPGRATVDLITVCPWSWVEQWQGTRWQKRGAEYEAFKARFTERMLEGLFAVRPQLRGKVDHAELSTPLSTEHFSAHPHGELYGVDHTPERFQVPIRAETHVKGLFLTGADLVSAGVAGALMGGVLSAGAILGVGALRQIMMPG